jgi:hypothetical protein
MRCESGLQTPQGLKSSIAHQLFEKGWGIKGPNEEATHQPDASREDGRCRQHIRILAICVDLSDMISQNRVKNSKIMTQGTKYWRNLARQLLGMDRSY